MSVLSIILQPKLIEYWFEYDSVVAILLIVERKFDVSIGFCQGKFWIFDRFLQTLKLLVYNGKYHFKFDNILFLEQT